MTRPHPTLVLFPGAWGNRTPELASWWMRHVIAHFRHDYEIIVIIYDGKALDAYVKSALVQLTDVPDGAVALCYSMGAQIARGVAAQRPRLFHRVALFSGLERIGVRVAVFLEALTFMIVPMLRTLIGRPLKFDTPQQVKRVFLHPLNLQTMGDDATYQRIERVRTTTATDLLDRRLVPEPAWAMLRLFLPGLRQSFPPFPCPVLAVVPHSDFVLPGVTYQDERVQVVNATGDHSLIIHNHNMATNEFNHIARWFHVR